VGVPAVITEKKPAALWCQQVSACSEHTASDQYKSKLNPGKTFGTDP
jgi:hypothetical protein